MNFGSRNANILLLLAMLAAPASAGLAQQPEDQSESDSLTVYGTPGEAAEMTEGPEVEGLISARSGDTMQVTTADGTNTIIAIDEATRIKGRGGFLGLERDRLAADSLLNGLPVKIRTAQAGDRLVARQIVLRNKDLRTASMIRTGTAQGFAEQSAATEALRGRVGDIDQYNVKSTTHVYFDVDKAVLSPEAKQELCATAATADAIDNALLLVVGYTDATGTPDYNQVLSERRAGSVVNHLQQACGWKPYRMLTPTGMSESQPVADNETDEGKSQNRRVAVNILVSKGLDGIDGL